MKSVLAVCLSPTFQRMLVFPSFAENEVNRSTQVLEIASGKGINVSRVLNLLGRPCTNLIQLGGRRVPEFLDLCLQDGLDVVYLPVEADIRTCTTVINEKDHTSTELVEEARTVEENDSDRFFSLFLSLVDRYDAVVIAGTKAEGFSPDIYPRMVEEAKKRGKMVILDIKGQDLKDALEKSPTVIKPNLSEFTTTFLPDRAVSENGESEDMKDEVERMLREIYRKYGTASIITRGKYDTWCFDGNEFSTVSNRVVLPVVNTIGCGDTLTASVTHALLEGMALKDAVQFGMDNAARKAAHLEQGL